MDQMPRRDLTAALTVDPRRTRQLPIQSLPVSQARYISELEAMSAAEYASRFPSQGRRLASLATGGVSRDFGPSGGMPSSAAPETAPESRGAPAPSGPSAAPAPRSPSGRQQDQAPQPSAPTPAWQQRIDELAGRPKIPEPGSKLDPAQTIRLAEKIAKEMGFEKMPPDGRKYGMKSGTPEEWGRVMWALILKESGGRQPQVDKDGNPLPYASTLERERSGPYRSLGIIQQNKEWNPNVLSSDKDLLDPEKAIRAVFDRWKRRDLHTGKKALDDVGPGTGFGSWNEILPKIGPAFGVDLSKTNPEIAGTEQRPEKYDDLPEAVRKRIASLDPDQQKRIFKHLSDNPDEIGKIKEQFEKAPTATPQAPAPPGAPGAAPGTEPGTGTTPSGTVPIPQGTGPDTLKKVLEKGAQIGGIPGGNITPSSGSGICGRGVRGLTGALLNQKYFSENGIGAGGSQYAGSLAQNNNYFENSGFYKPKQKITKDMVKDKKWLDSLPIGTIIASGSDNVNESNPGHVQIKVADGVWASGRLQGNTVLTQGSGAPHTNFAVLYPNAKGYEKMNPAIVGQHGPTNRAIQAEGRQVPEPTPAERERYKEGTPPGAAPLTERPGPTELVPPPVTGPGRGPTPASKPPSGTPPVVTTVPPPPSDAQPKPASTPPSPPATPPAASAAPATPTAASEPAPTAATTPPPAAPAPEPAPTATPEKPAEPPKLIEPKTEVFSSPSEFEYGGEKRVPDKDNLRVINEDTGKTLFKMNPTEGLHINQVGNIEVTPQQRIYPGDIQKQQKIRQNKEMQESEETQRELSRPAIQPNMPSYTNAANPNIEHMRASDMDMSNILGSVSFRRSVGRSRFVSVGNSILGGHYDYGAANMSRRSTS